VCVGCVYVCGHCGFKVSNAGVVHPPALPFSAVGETDAMWANSMNVNLMAHVWAAEVHTDRPRVALEKELLLASS